MRISQLAFFVRSLKLEKVALVREQSSISNMVRFRDLLKKIETCPPLRKLALNFTGSELHATTQDQLHIGGTASYDLFNKSEELVAILKGLKNGLSLIDLTPQPESVFILLPSPKELEIVIQNLKIIQDALQALVLDPEIGGELQVSSWEPGSLWVELFLGAGAAVTLVAGIASAAVVVRKKWIEGNLLMKTAESLGIRNDSLADIREKQDALLETLVSSEAVALSEAHFNSKKDFERIERLKHSIKLLSDLIAKGAEVHPALMAPEDISGLFPKYRSLPPGSGDQPLLANSTEE